MNNRSLFQIAALFVFLSTAIAGLAQIRSGTLVGKVVDPSGAPVPEAAVKVVAMETNGTSETVTNGVGEYTVPYLAAGRYIVTVTRPGFVTARKAEIDIGTATTVRADVQLELGTVSNIIEVASTVGELQTESPRSRTWSPRR